MQKLSKCSRNHPSPLVKLLSVCLVVMKDLGSPVLGSASAACVGPDAGYHSAAYAPSGHCRSVRFGSLQNFRSQQDSTITKKITPNVITHNVTEYHLSQGFAPPRFSFPTLDISVASMLTDFLHHETTSYHHSFRGGPGCHFPS